MDLLLQDDLGIFAVGLVLSLYLLESRLHHLFGFLVLPGIDEAQRLVGVTLLGGGELLDEGVDERLVGQGVCEIGRHEQCHRRVVKRSGQGRANGAGAQRGIAEGKAVGLHLGSETGVDRCKSAIGGRLQESAKLSLRIDDRATHLLRGKG